MLQITFAEASRLLHSLGCEVPAAEGHGCLCGALCTNHSYTFERWREELLADAAAHDDSDELTLRLLFSETVSALRETEPFMPLLPDDDVALEQRATALAQWTSGFLYGFGTALPHLEAALPPAVDEVLSDFARIAAAAVDSDNDVEEQEHAYAELVEYLRAGVWLVYAELAGLRERADDGAAQNDPAAAAPDNLR